MSNVKVNGNTYNNVTSIKLMKADGSGYAEYKEGMEATDTMMDKLLNRQNLGDIELDDASPCLEWLSGYEFGTLSCPYATTLKGSLERVTAENILLPNISTVTPTQTGNNSWADYGFMNCKITGVLDLSKLETVQNNAVQFTSSKIGTLKLGSYAPAKNIWNGTTITNFVWNVPSTTDFGNTGFWTYLNSATITNLYVPENVKETFQGKITDGTLTKITNLYSIDEWED